LYVYFLPSSKPHPRDHTRTLPRDHTRALPRVHTRALLIFLIAEIEDETKIEAVIQKLQTHLQSLPGPNYLLLIYLLKFLNELAEHVEITKMDFKNLALVFSSNIIRPIKESVNTTLKFDSVNNLIKVCFGLRGIKVNMSRSRGVAEG